VGAAINKKLRYWAGVDVVEMLELFK